MMITHLGRAILGWAGLKSMSFLQGGPRADRYKWSEITSIHGRKYMGNWVFITPISAVITLLITGRGPPCAWRIIPFSKWLITMASKSPK